MDIPIIEICMEAIKKSHEEYNIKLESFLGKDIAREISNAIEIFQKIKNLQEKIKNLQETCDHLLLMTTKASPYVVQCRICGLEIDQSKE
jgi:hypothetical protein